MKSRYWMIGGGIALLMVVAGALVWSQVRQTQTSRQETISTQVVSPTSATLASAQSQIELIISDPADGAVVSSPQLLIRGKTAPNAEVFINDKDTTADGNGNFSATLTLDEGENLIIVTANDAEGNMAEKELVVTYNVGE